MPSFPFTTATRGERLCPNCTDPVDPTPIAIPKIYAPIGLRFLPLIEPSTLPKQAVTATTLPDFVAMRRYPAFARYFANSESYDPAKHPATFSPPSCTNMYVRKGEMIKISLLNQLIYLINHYEFTFITSLHSDKSAFWHTACLINQMTQWVPPTPRFSISLSRRPSMAAYSAQPAAPTTTEIEAHKEMLFFFYAREDAPPLPPPRRMTSADPGLQPAAVLAQLSLNDDYSVVGAPPEYKNTSGSTAQADDGEYADATGDSNPASRSHSPTNTSVPPQRSPIPTSLPQASNPPIQRPTALLLSAPAAPTVTFDPSKLTDPEDGPPVVLPSYAAVHKCPYCKMVMHANFVQSDIRISANNRNLKEIFENGLGRQGEFKLFENPSFASRATQFRPGKVITESLGIYHTQGFFNLQTLSQEILRNQQTASPHNDFIIAQQADRSFNWLHTSCVVNPPKDTAIKDRDYVQFVRIFYAP